MDQQAIFKLLQQKGGKALKAFARKLNQPKVVKMEDYITDPDMLKDLKDPANQVPLSIGMGGAAGAIGGAIGSDSKNQARTDVLTAKNNSGSTNVGSLSSFMGGRQQESFEALTNPKAELDRGGKIVENSPVQTAGAFPPLSTPDFTPREEFDQYGKQFIS